MSKKRSDEVDTNSIDFEVALEQLEAIVKRLEQGNQPLEEALKEYAKAIELMRTCQIRLENAERRIEILSGVDGEGNPISRSVDDDEISLQEKQDQRTARRSVPRGQKPRSKEVDDDSRLF